MVRLLLKRGGDIFKVHVYETEEVHRSNALNDAFKIGSCFKKFGVEEYVRMMLDHDDGLSDLATKAAYALSAAAAIGDAERVKMYLEHGVKVEDCLKVGTHPLLNACKNEHVSVVKILLENGGVGINDTDPCSDSWPPRQSPLSWAIGRRNRQILRLLLTKGAHSAGKPLDDCGEEGPSISGLMLACIYNYRDMVKEVLSDSHIQVNWVNEEGMMALHYSCFRFMGDYIVSGTNATKNTDENERLGIVKDLLVAGARNPSADNCTPLELHLNNVISSGSSVTKPRILSIALIIKACGSRDISLSPFVGLMRRVVNDPDGTTGVNEINGIIKMAVLCRNRPSAEFVNVYIDFLSRVGSRNPTEDADWLLDIEQGVYTLKQLSRMKLREVVRPPLLVNALSPEIPLPKILKSYILFDDIIDTNWDEAVDSYT